MIRQGDLVRYKVHHDPQDVCVVIRSPYEAIIPHEHFIAGAPTNLTGLVLCVDDMEPRKILTCVPIEHLEKIR